MTLLDTDSNIHLWLYSKDTTNNAWAAQTPVPFSSAVMSSSSSSQVRYDGFTAAKIWRGLVDAVLVVVVVTMVAMCICEI